MSNLPQGWVLHPTAPGWAYHETTQQVVSVDQLMAQQPQQPQQPPTPPGVPGGLPPQYQQLPAQPPSQYAQPQHAHAPPAQPGYAQPPQQPPMPQPGQQLPQFGTHNQEVADAYIKGSRPSGGSRNGDDFIWVNMPDLVGNEVSIIYRLLPAFPYDRQLTPLAGARHRIPAKYLPDPPDNREFVYFDCPKHTREVTHNGVCSLCKTLDMADPGDTQWREYKARGYTLWQGLNLSAPHDHIIQVFDPQSGQPVSKVIPGVLRAGATLGDAINAQFARGRSPSAVDTGFPLELIRKKGNRPKAGAMNVAYDVDHQAHLAGPLPPELYPVLYNMIDLRTLIRFPSEEEATHIADAMMNDMKKGGTWQVPGQGTFQAHPSIPGHVTGPDGTVYPQTFMPQQPAMPPAQPNMPPALPPGQPQQPPVAPPQMPPGQPAAPPPPGPPPGHPAAPPPPAPPGDAAQQLAQSAFAAPRAPAAPPSGPPGPPPAAPAVPGQQSYAAGSLPPAGAPGLPPGGIPNSPPPPAPGQLPPGGPPPPPTPGGMAPQQMEAQFGTPATPPSPGGAPPPPPAAPPGPPPGADDTPF